MTGLDLNTNGQLNFVYCQSNKLSADALNALFGTLHENEAISNKAIAIDGNPVAGACDWSIATAKGWSTN